MIIHGFQKTTLLDYPNHLSALIFLGNCNMHCPFCHNASLCNLSEQEPVIQESEIFETLKKRKGILEGVCISGGEPTLHTELPDFIQQIKALGYLVKLDTNGTRPDVLQRLLEQHLLDYVAMDIKSSRKNYSKVCGIPNFDISTIEKSVALLQNSGISYEFRTTLVKELHSFSDLLDIARWLSPDSPYYLQNYRHSDTVPVSGLSGFSKEELLYFQRNLLPILPLTKIRGIDL